MRPTDFAAQLNVSLANGWGIVRTVTDLCMKMPEGKYVLVKDPNRVRLLSSISISHLFADWLSN
jgi:translation initiation factor 3 subunit D